MIVKVVQMREVDVQVEHESATAAFVMSEGANEVEMRVEVTVTRTGEDSFHVNVQPYALDVEGDLLGFAKDAVALEYTRDEIMDAG